MIKVLIVEDHDFTRQGLYFGLRKSENIVVVGEAINGKMAIDLAQELKPDVILMDIGLPFLNGIEATSEIKKISPNSKILMFTSYDDRKSVLSALNSGADGYCLKSIEMNDLINVVTTVSKGAIWVDPHIAKFIMEVFSSTKISTDDQVDPTQKATTEYNLTPRELEILTLLAGAMTNKEICEKLFLSTSTVKNHVSNIMQKLSVNDRTKAALVAINEGLIK